MKCPYCGEEFEGDNSHFCPKCGHKLSQVIDPKKVSFKDGIKNLFQKFFLFEGKDTRAIFNYGVLFLFLITIGINMLCSFFFMKDFVAIAGNAGSVAEANKLLAELVASSEFQSVSKISGLIIDMLGGIFLIAPIFRRNMDASNNKKQAIIITVIFGLGIVAGSVLNFISVDLKLIHFLLSVVNIAGSVMLVMSMLRQSNKLRLFEDADKS